jgi:cholesterol transport system auxiliary component
MSRSSQWMLASLPLLLSGCLSLHSNQPIQQQYVLTLSPAASREAGQSYGSGASGSSTASVQVLLPTAAAGLGGEGIAVLRPGQRLDYFSGARWAESVPQMVQMLIIEALRRQGSFRLVESDSGPFSASYALAVDITHFEADYTPGGDSQAGSGVPTAHVTLVCTLGRRDNGAAVTSVTINSSVSAQANRMQAVVAAFEEAAGSALTRAAQEVAPP